MPEATSPADGPLFSTWSPIRCALVTALPAWLLRVAYTRVYFGQEEEDWGNLGLIVGTAHSGFRYIETEHMPLYTHLSAAVYLLVGDAQLAGELVATTAGALTVGLVAYLAARWLGPATGVLAGALAALQPDLALLSATTLRTSTFTASAAACVLAAGHGRWLIAAALFWAAFLTRFDAMLSLLPALAIAALLPGLRAVPASPARRLIGVAVAAAIIPIWAAIYARSEGTRTFWGAVIARNTGNYEQLPLAERLGKGLETLWLVASQVLPDHLSWCVIGLVPIGLVAALRGRAASLRGARWLALVAATTAGVFALTVLLSAYRWDHNLYWKWLALTLPFVLPFAAHGAVVLVSGGRRWLATTLAVGLAVGAALPMYRQTWQQVIRSDDWMGTQVRLAAWIDRAIAPGRTILADLVPATALSGTRSPRPVLRWTQVRDEIPLDPAAFGAWLVARDVAAIVWFAEDWVGAAERAPWMAEARPHQAGPVRLEPIAAEPGYGFVAYLVLEPGESPPREPVPPDAGAIGSRLPP